MHALILYWSVHLSSLFSIKDVFLGDRHVVPLQAAVVEAAREVRWQNRSYVFFRVKTELSAEDGPIGGQGVPITDWRSIAIDRNVHTYGTPVYIDALLPTGMAETGEPFRRLMVAQDTGSAIVGHHDRMGLDTSPPALSWNSSHASRGCSVEALRTTGGAGYFYCFAAN